MVRGCLTLQRDYRDLCRDTYIQVHSNICIVGKKAGSCNTLILGKAPFLRNRRLSLPSNLIPKLHVLNPQMCSSLNSDQNPGRVLVKRPEILEKETLNPKPKPRWLPFKQAFTGFRVRWWRVHPHSQGENTIVLSPQCLVV